MGWATPYIAALQEGRTVSFRPTGGSMTPRIKSKQLCTVRPCEPSELQVDDVVLCRVRGCEYLHIVKAIQGDRFLIGGMRSTNGWIGRAGVFGRLVSVED